MSVIVDSVWKSFSAATPVLRDVSVEIATGELIALLGPSGSGKTTLLRILAGLESPDKGSVQYYGDDVTDLPAGQRNTGLVFQHYALFRHMTVFENVAFALRVRKRPDAEVKERVSDLLRLVHLESLAHRYPSQISGGQQQRVALARALAVDPRVLLLDEPFGALDTQVRRELRRWLRDLHDRLGVTTILVTHDQQEACDVADRLVVIKDGAVEQAGTPAELYANPATQFVAHFLGRELEFSNAQLPAQFMELHASPRHPAAAPCPGRRGVQGAG